MPRLLYSITAPQEGAVVGRTITVTGIARVVTANSGGLLRINVNSVHVEFGSGGPVLAAQFAADSWSCTGTLPAALPGGTQLTLTAVLRGTNQFNVGTPTEPEDGPEEPFEQRAAENVQVAVAPPPDFAVTAPAEGSVLDLHEGGGEVTVALTLAPAQFFPVTITISRDGVSTSEQFTGTQYAKALTLAPMPLGARTIAVSVANLDAGAPAQTRTLTGRDVTAPHLQVDSPRPAASILGDAQAVARLSAQGIAPDPQSGMVGGSAAVAWALSPTGPRTPARASTGSDLASWNADVPLSGFGAHTITFWATDQAGNTSAPLDLPVTVISSYVPATLAERLDEREYLAALLSFAQEQITVPGNPPSALDTRTLVDVLGQPADRLSQPLSASAERGVREVNQLRIPVELLRARIAATHAPTAPGAAGEALYRDSAYASLLAACGTSYPELRLARGAAPATRQALAARLGIRLTPGARDQLDELVLDGERRTEASLATVFGLPDSSGTDPLAAGPTALLLGWQLAGLALSWAEEDQQPGPLRAFAVLVDPDVISSADVLPGPEGEPIRQLLAQRAGELASYAQQLDRLRTAAPDAAHGLAAITASALPGLDLAELAALDARGGDIDPALESAGLSRVGFGYLRQLGHLSSTGPLSAAEWADAVAVLTRAHRHSLVGAWQAGEKSLVLSPDLFVPGAAAPQVNPFRSDGPARTGWQSVLRARSAQRENLIQAQAQAVAAAEQVALPILRDALLADLAPTISADAGEELSTLFLLDVLAGGTLRTTRLRQAIESVQSLLSAKRAGELPASHPAFGWALGDFAVFTQAWAWMGEFGSWQAATMAFLFPERHLDPTLLLPHSEPAQPLDTFFERIRGSGSFGGADADAAAGSYLAATGMAGSFSAYLDPHRSAAHQIALRDLSKLPSEHTAREVFWAVPMLLAQRLQSAGDYQSALDWYWILYPYDVSAPVSIFDRINTETPRRPDLTFPPGWTSMLDPFTLLAERSTPYTRYTLLALIRCHLDYADAEFTRESEESIAHARSLYVTARRLLGAAQLQPLPPLNTGEPALAIPELDTLRTRAQVQLAKLRQGRNIAGIPRSQGLPATTTTVGQPTPYRFKTLLDRARQLTVQAGALEAGFLAALEKYDERNLRAFDAVQGIDLSAAQVTLAASRVQEARDALAAAGTQQGRAETMAQAYAAAIAAPDNRYERDLLAEYSDLRNVRDGITVADTVIGVAQAASNASSLSDIFFSGGSKVALALGISATTVLKGGLEILQAGIEKDMQVNQLKAGIEQRRQEWRLQQVSAEQESQVAAAQVVTAADQVVIAGQEQAIATLQHDHALASLKFLNGQFTSADLYLWMSNTLGGVYRYFLQQATATARLAQAQLAFERAEPERTLVRNDYWRSPAQLTSNASGPDRRGLTGAEQLAEDLAQLDQYAFDSERRRLNLSQTLSLGRLMPVEFLEFRRTGVLAFTTPMSLFDNDFPGHYLRLIRQVRTSLVALVPPDRGIRATLYSNGISRVVTGREGSFQDVTVRHDPGIVALTSPVSASGVFELDAQSEMLLPFESSGVEASWEFRLPPAANPFDFASIADVLLTIDYTALYDGTYRSQLIGRLNANRDRGSDRVFSLARDFPDQWYDLFNPADPSTRTITLTLSDLDFPVGIEQLSTAALAVRLSGPDPVPDTVVSLHRGPLGGQATATGGIASTRRGTAAGWNPLVGLPPTGEWTLAVDPGASELFATLADVVLIVSWSGLAPAWTS